MIYFIVSDIHSDYRSLAYSLKRAGFNKRNKDHTLVVCGDIFDRFPETMKVYNFLTSIPKKRCILIKGNHEDLYFELLKKKFPEEVDFDNGVVDTFCHIAGYSPEIMTDKYWRKLQEKYPYERMKEAWQEIKKEVAQSKVTEWLKSKQWQDYFEFDKYICVHGFIPLKDLDHMPPWFVEDRHYEYFPTWREATEKEWYDSRWGCPYSKYNAGCFDEEIKNGKVLVCGHWAVDDFWRYIGNRDPEIIMTDIYSGEHIIGLDFGVYKLKNTHEDYHGQNVLVIDDEAPDIVQNQYGHTLPVIKPAPIIKTVSEKDIYK